MTKRNVIVSSVLCLSLLSGGAVLAQRPKANISPSRHPNLAAAQQLIDEAVVKIEAAQKANEFDLAGHARKAKELLNEASVELKKAAEVSNENRRK